ncbi:MAG: HAMP domain-containing histidine kinase, partial [Planctomycetes bacterium]|nr:HAMP domain-containing histidine kinase [Planctomycetota bacterium]
MRPARWLNISLATKCRLLFGGAVLLILAAALYVPLDRMGSLTDERYVVRAQQMAQAARLTTDFQGNNWKQAQTHLDQHWPAYAKAAGLDSGVPQLYPASTAYIVALFGIKGFKYRSIARFRAEPNKLFTYKIDTDDTGRTLVRLAMAVRAGPTDPYPGELKGMIYVETPEDPEQAFFNLVVAAGSALAAGLLALLVFYLITQRLILSPVRKLRRLAEKVTSGDLDARSQIATGDEYEALGEAFNDMLVHLKATQEELRTINKSLDTRLGELAETNVNLFEANKLKTEFLANVSHELRTPLVSIIGFAELLRDAATSPPVDKRRPARYADNILTSGRMLLDMINDLLDLAKIEAGKIDLHVSRFSMADVCDALMDFVRPLAEKKNLQIGSSLDDDVPALRSDSGKIKQILYNLLSNAIKFTPSGGRVDLHVGLASPGQIELTVSDTGPGIPAEKQAVIFEQFRQLDASATREYGGTGLGLAITRELSRMLGGSIRVESVEGQGSTFIVVLPIES